MSICMLQLGILWTDFHDNWYLKSFSKTCREKFKINQNLTRYADTLHEDQYTFLIISRSFLLRVRNVSFKRCRENQNTHFMSNIFSPPPKNRAFSRINVEKNTVESHKPKTNIYGTCALHDGYLRLQTHTHNM
jgi:hypothetical protein